MGDGLAEVWDILNAGPRHRFTAAGKLVGNCIDHGGNYWRHGHPNEDREWFLNVTDQQLQSERIDRIRDKKEREPITCPKCLMVRPSGPVCPGCGHKCSTYHRRVIELDGTLKERTGQMLRPRARKMRDDTQAAWTGCYHRAVRSKNGMSFAQAEALFHYEQGYWPPRTLDAMPVEPIDWYRRVKDVPTTKLRWDALRASSQPELF